MGVIGWELSSFEKQNVLFDIHEFDKNNIPAWIEETLEVPSEYMNLVHSKGKYFYYIEPSIGLGGYIIADTWSYDL